MNPPAAPPRLLSLPGAMLLRAVWQYRGFVLGMVGREFQARYLHSLLGSAWAVLNPLAMILIYTVIFSQVMRARLPELDDTLAYSLYLCAGILPWGAFTELLSRSVTVFLDHASLLKKVSFPRISLPVILLLSTSLNFAIVGSLFVLVLAVTGRFPGWVILAVLPLFALQQAFALGLGILLGTVNVFYRDVAQTLGVALQFWFWLTPIVYSTALLPEAARAWFALNPMAAVIGAYQQIIVAGQWPDWSQFRFHLLGALLTLALGFVAFHRLSGEMVDEL